MPVRFLHPQPPAHQAPRSVSDGKSFAVEEGTVYVDIIMAKGGDILQIEKIHQEQIPKEIAYFHPKTD